MRRKKDEKVGKVKEKEKNREKGKMRMREEQGRTVKDLKQHAKGK